MKHLILGFLLTCMGLVNAQTLGNMPFTTSQVSNPSFIALNELPTLNVYGKIGRYSSSSYAGYHQYSSKLKGTWGVFFNGYHSNYFNDFKANSTKVGFSYARSFKISDRWSYSLGAGIGLSGGGYNYQGELSFDFGLGVNVGGTLYGKNLFTALNLGYSITGVGRIEWKTGYKITPVKSLDLSITPIVTINNQVGYLTTEANVNIAYKKLNLNLGYNGGASIGFGYDFNRFRLNYALSNIVLPHASNMYHEAGIQIKLGKKRQDKRAAEFNHRLF